jgi:hypothetical protein
MKCFALCFLLLTVLVSQSSFAQCTSQKPKKLVISGETGCKATLSWKPVANNDFYTVKFKGTSGPWTFISTEITDTFYTFTGLQPNVPYTFAVASHCSPSSVSTYAKKTQEGMPCSPPLNVTATGLSSSSVKFSWSSCGSSSSNQLRYKKLTATKWKYVSTGTATITTLTFDGTKPIMYQATGCSDTTGNWSALDTFYFSSVNPVSRPNAIVILLDDSRYDTYSCNGAPSFFQTPYIDRVANEGVNFKKCIRHLFSLQSEPCKHTYRSLR